MERLSQVAQLPFEYHLFTGALIRFVLVMYSQIHDEVGDVKYTDIDYKVFTDAARHVLDGESPFNRHTYRYSPIIAWMMTPNILLYESVGKIFFSAFDIMITMLIESFVHRQLKGKMNASKIAKYCSMFWLYNPLTIIVSTRGNADSVSCFFILASLYFLQSNSKSLLDYMLSGMFLGISIHLRLYPLVFSFPMYLSLGEYKISRTTSILDGLMCFIPNRKQIALAFSTIISFVALTYGMFLLYGYQFIFETYIYHIFRKDTRHNFSVFFYYSYLTMDSVTFDIVKFTSYLFVFVILFLLSVAFGCDAQTLPFALFCQAAVLVTYNSVITSQYFLWYLSLLPLVVHDFRASRKEAVILGLKWSAAQVMWLLHAYLLEFHNSEVYIVLWVMSLLFFASNIMALHELIHFYWPGYGFGMVYGGARPKSK